MSVCNNSNRSMSRPMLGLVLMHPEIYEEVVVYHLFSKLTVCLQLRQQIVGSYSGHNQELVAKSFGELVEGQFMISPDVVLTFV